MNHQNIITEELLKQDLLEMNEQFGDDYGELHFQLDTLNRSKKYSKDFILMVAQQHNIQLTKKTTKKSALLDLLIRYKHNLI